MKKNRNRFPGFYAEVNPQVDNSKQFQFQNYSSGSEGFVPSPSCPPGQVSIGCAGRIVCVPIGASCCGTNGTVCAPGYHCDWSGGYPHCVSNW